jgi:hypothetical protein
MLLTSSNNFTAARTWGIPHTKLVAIWAMAFSRSKQSKGLPTTLCLLVGSLKA